MTIRAFALFPILIGFFLGTALMAQVARNHEIPLKNWPTPLYWQPAAVETEGTGLRPEIRTPTPEAATPAGSLVFVAMTPCRVVDTRTSSGFPNPFGPPSLSPYPSAIRTFPIQLSTNCSIPSIAQAYSFNVTIIPNPLGSSVGYVTIYPTTASPNTPPTAVTLDDITGDIRNNAAIVPAGISNGSVSVVTNGNGPDLVIDINGYYAPSTGITLAQGTYAAPSLSFMGDPTTGIFSAAPQRLNFTTGGTPSLSVGGGSNTSIGFGDLAFNTSGTDNTATGYRALYSNTTGFQNTANGSGALQNNTTGGTNTANGYQALLSNTTGGGNTASGYQALLSNTTGGSNTASGSDALAANTTGFQNTASGWSALAANTTGTRGTAMGYLALGKNTTGGQNTATGTLALYTNTTGNGNTADGDSALYYNTTGVNNTATGIGALQANTTANNNTANGSFVLFNNSTGSDNTASGASALLNNTTGTDNTATGTGALNANTTGNNNTAYGVNALNSNTTGFNNIAVGSSAGTGITTTGNNIDIGNQGTSTDSNVIRIGTGGTHTSFFAAGIAGVMVTGSPVVVDAVTGQLGTASSSRRYKEDIQDMSDASSGLLKLRPVTFRYQKPYADGTKPLDYGLIAEEVGEVYPDLVVRNAAGQIETVQYQKLTPMLLNELQKDHETILAQAAALQKEHEMVHSLHETVNSLQGQLSTLQKKLETLINGKE